MFNALCLPSNNPWEGMHGGHLLLDLDQGSMTAWKNRVKLGVMIEEGLSGPLCWAVYTASVWDEVGSARIEAAPTPTSPTEEDLAAAKEFARANVRRVRRQQLHLPLTATDAECEAAERPQQQEDY